jgi:hypothetical protein
MKKQATKTPKTRRAATKKPSDHDRAMQVVEDMICGAEFELKEFKKSLSDVPSICQSLVHGGDGLLEAVGRQGAACALSRALAETGSVDQAILLAYDRVQEFNDDEELKDLRDGGCGVWPHIRQAEADAYAAFIKKLPARWHHDCRHERGVA